MTGPNLRERLHDLASEAPDALEVPQRMIQRARRRVALTLAGAVALLVVLVFVVTTGIRALPNREEFVDPSPSPADAQGGFIGVPPEGAVPTAPVSEELVLSLDTTVSYGGTFKTLLYLYSDGRLIWERHAAETGVPEGARPQATGYLMQVLTPEGVEALKSEILDTGLFEGDLHLAGEFEGYEDIYGVRISVLDDQRMVSLTWAAGYDDQRPPTPDELDTIAGLVDRLEDPGAWLPEAAWQDREIRAYVASSYSLNFSLVTGPDGCCLNPDPSELPPPADEILGSRMNQCITTEDAIRLAAGFEAAGITSTGLVGWSGAGAEYDTGIVGTDGVPMIMSLYPNLPDWSC